MLQDDSPCLHVACANLLGKISCIFLNSLQRVQSRVQLFPLSSTARLLSSLPEALSHCEWLSAVSATQALHVTLMIFRFHLCSCHNLALSLNVFWPTSLHINLEIIIISPAGFYTLPLLILHYVYKANCTIIHTEGKIIQPSSLHTVDEMHMPIPSLVKTMLIFHEEDEKTLTVTNLSYLLK